MAKSILIVEDDADIATVLRMCFQGDQYALSFAADLESARAALDRPRAPDLVLLDLQLADGDGLDLCRWIKARQPAVPVLVLTASPDRQHAARASGADLFIAKPFDLDALEAAVRRVLGGP